MGNALHYISPPKEGFKNELFDRLLAAGYYRMQHLMFTCNETVINSDYKTIPVFWLRTLVQNVLLEKAARNILKKCAGFTVLIEPAYIDDEIETLYAAYKAHVQFEVSSSCASYLHQPELPEPFDSMMIKVIDGNKLIAAGYFDKGSESIAGIINIYHPQYRAYSPGKFLILQKLQYALSKNMQYYYTGYISTESIRFDYKTFPDAEAVEVLLPLEQTWAPYSKLGKPFLEAYYLQMLHNL
ncbi:hypothetical protein [Parafilimonas sp.]|uniref:hypothetical protein n=1 Tax=Parafilimonas sp. TaxID=1969739 RepID=UPI003F7E2494